MVLFFLFKLFLMTLIWGGGDEPEYNICREQKQKKKKVIDLFFLLKGVLTRFGTKV